MKQLPEHISGLGKMPRHDPGVSPYGNIDTLRSTVREALQNTGLGKEDPENPFADIIFPDTTVLLKPNWVLHFNKSGKGMECMITHPNFIEATIREVAKTRPKKIIIGDAPIQSTIFSEIVTPQIADRFRRAAGEVELEIRDFRSTICIPERTRLGTVPNPKRSAEGILYDLGADSLIEPLSKDAGSFRNTSYDHRALSSRHHPGRHQYLLSPEIIESDLIINLPKLKTHRKAGLTAALKNIVGLNGDKDYLPHHRVGGSDEGGDCYPGRNRLKRAAEFCLDMANQRINSCWDAPWRFGASKLLHMNCIITGEDELEGSWYGNDTLWRMVLDLNRILLYGKKGGVMTDTRQRTVYSLTDAIIVGEGFGPLSPEPKYLGLASFSASSPFADLMHAALMHFDWQKIPVVLHSFDQFRYPLVTTSPDCARACYESSCYTSEEVASKFGSAVIPAPGWKNHIEMEL